MKLPVSVFIIALNEADRIGRVIESVRGFADEVIVVDSESTDDTASVCRFMGAHVFSKAFNGYGEQKRFGEDQCKNRWLLNLDADEIASFELAEEIRQLFVNAEPPHAAYSVRVCHMLPGEAKPPHKTQVNTVIRLYDRNRARFSDSPVHDSVIVAQGTVGALHAPVYHPSYRSYTHALDKVNRYSTMQAEDMVTRGQQVSTVRIYVEFFGSFIKAYFFRGYVFRGTRGFNYAMLYAFSRFARLAKWYELTQGNPKP